MTARAIVLLRHGQTDYNKAFRMQGQIDIPLNETGREQARRAADVLASVDFSRIVASDLSRATETARILGDAAGLDVEIDERLRERGFGDWEGHTREELEASHPVEYEVWRGGGDPVGVGVETREDAAVRMAEIITEVGAAAEDGEVVALVAHGAIITLGIGAVLGLGAQWYGFGGMGNCHWSVLAQNPGREPDWRLGVHNVGVDLVPRPHVSTFEKPATRADERGDDQQVTGASGRMSHADRTGVPER
ncbi:MAG: histidine phosphatase family protein [Actinomycetaceae bacterium]